MNRGEGYVKYPGMDISHYTDYAYRVLMYLAVNKGRRVTMAEIAGYYVISHEHLRKVVHHLSSLSYINTYGGKGGGMELNLSPDEINIGQVFLDFEGFDPLIDCDRSSCPLRTSCGLSRVFAGAQDAFLDALKQHTLADVLASRKMVRMLTNS